MGAGAPVSSAVADAVSKIMSRRKRRGNARGPKSDESKESLRSTQAVLPEAQLFGLAFPLPLL